MEKPRAFIHWTNNHKYYDELGVIRIGRVTIPLAWLFGVYGVILGVLLVGAFVFYLIHPENSDGDDIEVAFMFYPFLYALIPLVVGGLIAGVTALALWTRDAFDMAKDG